MGKITCTLLVHILNLPFYFPQFDIKLLSELVLENFINPDFDKDFVMRLVFDSYFKSSEEIMEQADSSILKIVTSIVENCKTSQIKLEYLVLCIEARFTAETIFSPISRRRLETLIETIFDAISEENLVYSSLIETVQTLKKQLLLIPLRIICTKCRS